MRYHALIALLVTSTQALADEDIRNAEMFASWRAANEPAVTEFAKHLDSAGLAGQVEFLELLRSASDWQRCEAAPFAVPPAAQWPDVDSVLTLVRELRRIGVLGKFEVHSAYRNGALNQCADGAPKSAHFRSFAIDLSPRDGIDPGPALCKFWQEQGRDWKMGLSRYPSGRIHIDTSGYRTWGADHTGKTAFCSVVPAQEAPSK
ncbi:MAG TPA: hypothetical protein VGM81_03835 [Burkholderiaceae bacterium]